MANNTVIMIITDIRALGACLKERRTRNGKSIHNIVMKGRTRHAGWNSVLIRNIEESGKTTTHTLFKLLDLLGLEIEIRDKK
jgi:hypothetical protein